MYSASSLRKLVVGALYALRAPRGAGSAVLFPVLAGVGLLATAQPAAGGAKLRQRQTWAALVRPAIRPSPSSPRSGVASSWAAIRSKAENRLSRYRSPRLSMIELDRMPAQARRASRHLCPAFAEWWLQDQRQYQSHPAGELILCWQDLWQSRSLCSDDLQ